MNRRQRKSDSPRRARVRTKPTVNEEPVRVAIATVPRSDSDGHPNMQPDVALIKAAMLYADEVELVGLGASLFAELQKAMGVGGNAGFNLLAAMDDQTVNYIASRSGSSPLPSNWRETIGQAISLDPDVVEKFDPGAAAELRDLQSTFAHMDQQTVTDVEAVFESMGARELVSAMRSNFVTVADLGLTASSTLRPADVRATESDRQIWNWIDALTTRLADRRTRLLFDREAGDLVQSMYEAGTIAGNPEGMRLAAQAALGVGFAERLPSFPMAKMDELIDLRADLTLPLARYRGAVVRFSKDIQPIVGDGLNFEVQQRWEETVRPELIGLEQELADHDLVRELARSLDVKDVRNFGYWTSATYCAFATSTDLDALTTGLVATGASAVPQALSVALKAFRARREAANEAESNELFFLYEANRRFEK